MSDILSMIQRKYHAILTDGEEPCALLIPKHLEPMLKQGFGLYEWRQPVEWKTYSGMNIEWKSAVTQLSIRTSTGDVRICQ